MKKEDSVILFNEQEVGKFERIVFFVFADDKRICYCQYEFDSILYESFNKMNNEGQERFLNRLVKDNMYELIKELDSNSISVWLKDHPEIKQKYREFKLNKIIN